ncbi:MAG TPA: glycosyltransferase [Microthrixaceae bacterium]|nr:glycosyltransferase [Microthrixaceae bacterium]
MKLLRRFVGVGAFVTVLDIVLLVVFVQAFDMTPVWADAAAIAIATVASYAGHHLVHFEADPSRRWYRNHPQFVATSIAAAAVDMAVLWLVTGGADEIATRWLVPAKLLSLATALVVRIVFYRWAMFEEIRGDQQVPAERPSPPGQFRLSVVIPAFKEEAGIGATVARVREELDAITRSGGLEVIVVDDGSPDQTAARATDAGADQVIRLERNSGKGAAVRRGMLAARGRCVAFTDADLSYAPAQIAGLLERIEEGWDVVVGSRKHTDTTTLVAARRLREVGGRIINLLTSMVLLGQYRDTQCGLKAFRSDVARLVFARTTIDGFAFDVEVFHLVERYRLTLCEVPVEVVNSSRSTVKVVRDALRLVRDLFRIRRQGRAGGYEVTAADLPSTLDGVRRELA